jgi:small subunit ribosomal protein S17
MADEETPEVEETTPPEESSAPEAVAADETEGEAPAQDATDSGADDSSAAAPAEPAEALPPKERRRRAKAEKANAEPARPERSPEERQAERTVERQRKAAVRRVGRVRGREKARARKGETRETPAREREPGKQKTQQGVVVSDKATKTITVRIDTTSRHPRYKKIVRTSRTLHAHDENGDAGLGDTVVVRESRPLSRTKRWRLVRVVEKAE